MLDQETTNKINQAVTNVVSTHKIILFGSHAYGIPDSESDIDLCIVMNESDERKIDRLRKIRRSISDKLPGAFDLLVYDKEEFADRAGLNVTLEYKIANEGIYIYG